MNFYFGKSVKSLIINNISVQQVRFYCRWSHRRPVRVYTPEEYEKNENEKKFITNHEIIKPEISNNINDNRKGAVSFKVKRSKLQKPLIANQQKSKVKSTVDMLETVLNEDGSFIYTKMKDSDTRIGIILTDIKSKKVKQQKDLILLEGKRIIRDALLSGCQLKYILFSRKGDLEFIKPHLPKIGLQLYKMPYREIQMWSDLTTSPGIMGVFKVPNVEDYEPKESVPITVICDNVREPGNLGAILRICAGVGCSSVILTSGCVNLWDTKVLRSSAGAHFKLRIKSDVKWPQIEEILASDSRLFIADNNLIQDHDGYPESIQTLADSIPVLPYSDVNYANLNNLVLVVGGETLGVSRDSYELALKTNGARLNIPLCNDVDSLNVGAALGVIVFEMRKYLVNK